VLAPSPSAKKGKTLVACGGRKKKGRSQKGDAYLIHGRKKKVGEKIAGFEKKKPC